MRIWSVAQIMTKTQKLGLIRDFRLNLLTAEILSLNDSLNILMDSDTVFKSTMILVNK